MKKPFALRREAAGLYRGGPKLRFTARRLNRKAWLVSDRLTGRREKIKRLKDARIVFQFILMVEPVAVPGQKETHAS